MKGIILDMDGVIIDSEQIHYDIEIDLLNELGGNLTPKEHKRFLGTNDYYMWSTLKDEFDLKLSVEDIIKMKSDRFYNSISNIELVPNFDILLNLIINENYKIAIASSNDRRAIKKVIEYFNLTSHIDYYISGEDVTESKPNPEIFLKAAENLNLDTSKCIVIEDSRNGVLAANAANIKSIGLNNPNSGKQDLSTADFIVDNLDEINIEMLNSLIK